MKTYWVYMLLCGDGSFYVGITNDVDRRLGEHQFGVDPTCYSSSRRPLTLVHSSEFHDVYDAIAWEKHLKGWSRAKKMALIKNDWPEIHKLAECSNQSAAKFFSGPEKAQRILGSSFDSAQDDKNRLTEPVLSEARSAESKGSG